MVVEVVLYVHHPADKMVSVDKMVLYVHHTADEVDVYVHHTADEA